MKLDRDFLKERGIKEYRVDKKFESKKNDVFLIDASGDEGISKYVVKCYKCEESFLKETQILNILIAQNVNVPKVYYTGTQYIITEYLGENTLLNAVSRSESRKDSICSLSTELCKWMSSFYAAAGQELSEPVILWDMNFRNFILKDKLYCVDFEDCRKGCPEEDIGRACAFFVTYDPMFTEWKIKMLGQFFNILVDGLSLDRKSVIEEFKKELSSMEKRRGVSNLLRDIL